MGLEISGKEGISSMPVTLPRSHEKGNERECGKGRGLEAVTTLTLLTWSLMVLMAVSKSQMEKIDCFCSSDSRVPNLASSSLESRLVEDCSTGEGKGGGGEGERGGGEGRGRGEVRVGEESEGGGG